MEKNILIVDDDRDQRDVLRATLELFEYRVLEAANITDAKSVIQNDQVDLIITDVEMPGGTGIDLLKSVKVSHPQIPTIIHTGMPKFEAAVECVKIGAVDYLQKPVAVKTMMDIVRAALAAVDESKCMDAARTLKMDRVGCIFGGYEIIKTLGEGSFGVVFLARRFEKDIVKNYAIKLIKPPTLGEDDSREYLERFLHEADAGTRVLHPNVISVVDHGLAEDGMFPYLVMEYFRGQSLKELMKEGCNLDYRQKTKIILQIAEALAAVHAHGIFHRDIKPDNVMIDEDFMLKVMDFGVARLPESELTVTTTILGTPFYLSPEGFLSAKVDHRADIYSLGVLAYELFLGKKPFDSKAIAVLMRLIMTAPPLEPSKIDGDFSPGLQDILAVMLKKDRDQRYQSANELIADLRDFLDSNIDELRARLKDRLEANDWE